MDGDPPSPLQVVRCTELMTRAVILNQEDVFTYTAERKTLTPQLHSEGTAACNHILPLYNKAAKYKLCIKKWVAALLTVLLLYHS